MSADHASRAISVTIFLQSLPAAQRGFSDVLLLVDLATNPLEDRVTIFNNATEAAAAQVAGDISTVTLAALQAMFSQAPRIRRVKVGTVDTADSETWAQAYAACVLADPEFYGVAMLSRAAADIGPVATAIAAEGERRLFAQSALADWLTSGKPTAYTTLATNERLFVLYDADNKPAAEAYMAKYLAFDPDQIAATAVHAVNGVVAPVITPTQRDFIIENNANVGLAMGSAPYFVMDGKAITGKPLYELTSADWLRARIAEDLASLRVERSGYGLKIPTNLEGMALVLARVRRRLEQGKAVGHFDDAEAVGETITSDDLANGRLRVTVRAQIQGDVIEFAFTAYLSRDPIAAE